MTINEIKEHLGIDLTIKDRRRVFVILKAIYVKDNLKKENAYNLSKNLKLTNATVLSLIRNFKRLKEDNFYEKIKLAYDTKDKNLFDEILLTKKDYDRKEYNRLYRLGEHKSKPKSKPKGIIPHPKKRWHYLRIIEVLRKDNNHKLWDKLIPDFNTKDYKELRKLSTM